MLFLYFVVLDYMVLYGIPVLLVHLTVFLVDSISLGCKKVAYRILCSIMFRNVMYIASS